LSGKLRLKRKFSISVSRSLGVRRSWHHPFGSPPREVDAATVQWDLARSELGTLKRQLDQTKQAFLDWQKPAKQYHEWRYSDLGEQMHQVKAILDLKPVQERLGRLQEAQAREQQRQRGLQVLQAWQEVAMALNKPAAYVKRIQEVTADYRAGEPLSDQAREAMQQDVAVYEALQERQRQRELEQGFCL
jgi:hypothetical protein